MSKRKPPVDEARAEPGQVIVEGTCPCCGAIIVVEHGDDPGEIVFLGEIGFLGERYRK